MNKFIVIFVILFVLLNSDCYAKDFQNYTVKKYSPQWACCLENYINSHIQFRETVYNAINLTDEQEEIFHHTLAENAILYREKSQHITQECVYLQELIDFNAAKNEINQQKKVIKQELKDLKKLIHNETQFLKPYMNKYQIYKYKLITTLERNDVNKECRFKDYYEKNPQMQKFGDLE